MLYIDIVDIIYFVIGIAVGVMLTTLVDFMMCKHCLDEIMNDVLAELKEGEISK